MGFYLNVTVTDKSCTEGLKFNRVLYWKELFWVSIFLEVKDDNIRQTAVGALIPALDVKEVKKELFKKKVKSEQPRSFSEIRKCLSK